MSTLLPATFYVKSSISDSQRCPQCPQIVFTQSQIDSSRWQRRIWTLSVQLYSYVTSDNPVFVSDKIINNSDNFRTKCLSYSKISAILCVLYFLFLHFLFNLEKHVN